MLILIKLFISKPIRIRILLFTSIRIRILLLIEVLEIFDHWSVLCRPSNTPF
jgi:hypothetical protein